MVAAVDGPPVYDAEQLTSVLLQDEVGVASFCDQHRIDERLRVQWRIREDVFLLVCREAVAKLATQITEREFGA